jgi:hypothetical protein
MATQSKNLSTSPDLSKTFQRLAESAARLNQASDELSKAIAPIETTLKKLNLGISKWYPYAGGVDPDGSYDYSEIGYSKVGGKWCLAIAERSGHEQAPYGDESFTAWAFNDAPRQMRIQAVKAIPKLIEALVDEAEKVTVALETETMRAQEVAETLITLSSANAARR